MTMPCTPYRSDAGPLEVLNRDGGQWSLFEAAHEPAAELVTSAFVFGYHRPLGGVVLMQARRNGTPTWGMTGGHVGDTPYEDETPRQAAVREAHEEGGLLLHPDDLSLLAVRQIWQPDGYKRPGGKQYGPETYITYYGAVTDLPLSKPTGPDVVDSHCFSQTETKAIETFDQAVLAIGFRWLALSLHRH